MDPGGAQKLCRPPRQPSRLFVDRAQLQPVVGGLLEVVSDRLLGFGEPIARCSLLEICQALMELRPLPLRERRVGSVADEDVLEAVGVGNFR